MSTNETTQSMPTPAMRLIFEYDGDQVRLVSQHPVEMTATEFDLAQARHPGYYVDIRDAAGVTLSRVLAHNALSGSAEVFPEHHGDQISRVDVAKPQGAFSVVIPLPAGSDHVSVVRLAPPKAVVPPVGGQAAASAPSAPEVTELGKFPLHISR